MSDSPEEVLAPTSPQGLGVPITPVWRRYLLQQILTQLRRPIGKSRRRQ